MTALNVDADLLDALITDTCQRLASIVGLACSTDPGNQLQLLGILQTGIRDALAEAVLEAIEAGYTDNEIHQLHTHQELIT